MVLIMLGDIIFSYVVVVVVSVFLEMVDFAVVGAVVKVVIGVVVDVSLVVVIDFPCAIFIDAGSAIKWSKTEILIIFK